MNLLSNSLKFTQEGHISITISARRVNNRRNSKHSLNVGEYDFNNQKITLFN
jgi:signal transduction histidine kinase